MYNAKPRENVVDVEVTSRHKVINTCLRYRALTITSTSSCGYPHNLLPISKPSHYVFGKSRDSTAFGWITLSVSLVSSPTPLPLAGAAGCS